MQRDIWMIDVRANVDEGKKERVYIWYKRFKVQGRYKLYSPYVIIPTQCDPGMNSMSDPNSLHEMKYSPITGKLCGYGK